MVSRLPVLFVSSCLILLAGTAPAQQARAPQPELLQLVTIKVKPGGNAAFEEYVNAVRRAAEQLESQEFWLTAQSVSGEPSYTIALPRASGWAALGDPGVLARLAEAFGEQEAKRLAGLAMSSTESVHTSFYQSQPGLSNPRPQMETAPAAVIMYELAINPGMQAQYAETAALTREAAMAVDPNRHYLILAPSFGANGVIVVGFVEQWSDLDQNAAGPAQLVIQHFGQATGAAITARAQETIANMTITLHRTRPDLSYEPQT